MVGFPPKSTNTLFEGQLDQDPKVSTSSDSVVSFNPKLEDFSFLDSFLDFDSINWLGSERNLGDFTLEDNQFGFLEDGMEMTQDNQTILASESEPFHDTFEASGVKYAPSDGPEQVMSDASRLMVDGPKPVSSGRSEPLHDAFEASGVTYAPSDGPEQVMSDTSKLMADGPKPVSSVGSELIESAPVVLPIINVEEEELKKTEGLTCSIAVGMEKVRLAADGDGNSDGTKNESDSSESESQVSCSSSSTSASGSSCSSSEEESNEEVEKKKEELDARKEDDVAGELEEGEIKGEDDEELDEDEYENGDDDDNADAMIAWSDDEDEDHIATQNKEPVRSKNELKELPPVPAVDATLEPHHAMLPVGVILSVLGAQVIVEGVEKHNPLNEGSILWITEKRVPLGIVDEIFGPVRNPYYVVRYNEKSEVPDGIHEGTPISFVAEFAGHVLNDKNVYKKGCDASGENDEEISDEAEFSDDEKEAEYRRVQKMAKRRGRKEEKAVDMENKNKKNGERGRQMNRYPGQSSQPPKLVQRHALPSMLPTAAGHPDPQLCGAVGMGGLVPWLQQVPVVGSGVGTWGFQNNQQQPYPDQMGMPNMMPLAAHNNAMMLQQQMSMPNMNLFGGLWAAANAINQTVGIGPSSTQGNMPIPPQFGIRRPFFRGRGRGRGRGRFGRGSG